MNILIVDDDKLVRLFLTSLLAKKLQVTVEEAENGLEALVFLEDHPIDLVLLDISMPVLDGYELLKIIRTTSALAAIPVIVMSSSDEKNTVVKLIQLGISDYILKPFKNGSEIFARISKILLGIRDKKEMVAEGQAGGMNPRLLLIDKDPNFRSFFQAAFSSRFELTEASSPAMGLKTALQLRPEFIIISEGLAGLDEITLAGKIKALDPEKKMKVFYCYDSPAAEARAADSSLFDGFFKKSFVPDLFGLTLLKTLLNEESVLYSLVDVLKNQLTPELISSIRQTFGVMSYQEVVMLPPAELPKVMTDRMASVDLINSQDGLVVTLGLALSSVDVRSLSVKVNDGNEDAALTALTETIAGSICSSLAARGFAFQKSITDTAGIFGSYLNHDIRLLYPFKTDSGEKFIIGLFMANN